MITTLILILRFALTAALYAFLGWAIFTLWRDLRQQQATQTARQTPPLRLSIRAGETTSVKNFTHSPVLIGRGQHCDCAIDDRTLSSQHSRLSYHHHQWWLEDLGSTNGTLLHGEQVTTPVVVASGDPITCGKVEITVQIETTFIH
jgi:pSer/pThr/pTyr-binding forkhead associated (FHA) protein